MAVGRGSSCKGEGSDAQALRVVRVEGNVIMLLCYAVRALFLPVNAGRRVLPVLLILCGLCASVLRPCAAQNPPPLSAGIANGQPSVTVPFVAALAAHGQIPIEVRTQRQRTVYVPAGYRRNGQFSQPGRCRCAQSADYWERSGGYRVGSGWPGENQHSRYHANRHSHAEKPDAVCL